MYRPQLPLLAKLMFLSSAIHQTVFMLLSSLPFAIGQVLPPVTVWCNNGLPYAVLPHG